MSIPSVKRALPQIAGTDTADVPRDVNALIAALEAEVGYVATRDVLEVGMVGNTRAGRQLAASDFTDLGLTTPIGLYSMGVSGIWLQTNDSSGNGRDVTNKGAVPQTVGITGAAASASLFAGSTAQVLYRVDTGAADPFRVRTGSWGCWFRTAKRGVGQYLLAKDGAAPQRGWSLFVGSGNGLGFEASIDGTAVIGSLGVSDVADDRWHFGVATFDGGQIRVFVDGTLESVGSLSGVILGSSGPLNIGGRLADAATATTSPHFGRIDEAFVTNQVLTEDQIRCLYAVKVPHAAPRTPRRAGVSVRRRRRGAPLVVADFPTQPRRLYNFTNDNLTDLGVDNQVLANANLVVPTGGADGAHWGAYYFNAVNQYLNATDTGLPAGVADRSMGFWVHRSVATGVLMTMVCYGAGSAVCYRVYAGSDSSTIYINDGVDRAAWTGGQSTLFDGQWHFVVATSTNVPADGIFHRLYCDGKCVAINNAGFTATALGGASSFRVARDSGVGTQYFGGDIDGVFVCDYVLTPEQIRSLYAKSTQALGLSPKDTGCHVERIDATNLYFVGDSLEPQHQIDLEVAA